MTIRPVSHCFFITEHSSKECNFVASRVLHTAKRLKKNRKTLIDVIATTHEQNIVSSIMYANSISANDLVGIVMKKNNRKFTPRRVRKRNFAKYNVTAYKNDLAGQNWDSVYKEQDDNNAWNSFKNALKEVMDKHAPFTDQKVRGRDCSWLYSEIRSKIHERDYWLKRARKSGKELDWSTYRRLRNVVTRLIRNSKSNYTRNLFRENVNTPNKFWKHIKKCFPTKEMKGSNSKVINIHGNVTSDTKKIANGFSKFFAKIGKNLEQKLISLSNSTWKHHDHSFWGYSLNPRNSILKFQETNIIVKLKIS